MGQCCWDSQGWHSTPPFLSDVWTHGSRGQGGVGGGDLGWCFCAFTFDKGLLAVPVGGTQGAPPGPRVQCVPPLLQPRGLSLDLRCGLSLPAITAPEFGAQQPGGFREAVAQGGPDSTLVSPESRSPAASWTSPATPHRGPRESVAVSPTLDSETCFSLQDAKDGPRVSLSGGEVPA